MGEIATRPHAAVAAYKKLPRGLVTHAGAFGGAAHRAGFGALGWPRSRQVGNPTHGNKFLNEPQSRSRVLPHACSAATQSSMPSRREKNNLGRKQRILPAGLVPEGPSYLLHGRLEDRRPRRLAIAQLLLCSRRTILPCAPSCKMVVLWDRQGQQHTIFVRHPSMRREQPAVARPRTWSPTSERQRAAPS